MKKTVYAILLFLAGSVAIHAVNTEIKYLSGTDADNTVEWDFRCDKGRKSGKWGKIAVPSCWEQQGYGDYTYGRYYIKNRPLSDESGDYRTTFAVPEAWKGRRIEIVFEGVMTDASVKVNGKIAGAEHQGGFTSFSYDITDLVRTGKRNTLEVHVEKNSKDESVHAAERKADWWLFGGIYRPVYLRATPQTALQDVAIDAQADGTLNLWCEPVKGNYSLRMSISEVQDTTGRRQSVTTKLSCDNGRSTASARFAGVKAWNPESPNLYRLSLELIDETGKTVHTDSKRIGFRTIKFHKRDGFYLNGKKIALKGVNRHCFYPETGRTTSVRLDLADAKLIKKMNANAVRSHYPPGETFLNICDSIGLLYLDELPGWQDAYDTTVGKKLLKEMIAHDVNHPCIFAWSNGNEGGFNYELDSLFSKYDPQGRHVVHAWALFDGIDAHHYPAYQTGVARLHNGYQVFMPTEFLHAQYDKGAGASLSEYWSQWGKNPLFAGGFIWAWADEGIVRTDRNGQIDTDGPEGPDGIVGPHREREGSWYAIRSSWSPVRIDPLRITPQWDGRFLVQNNYLFNSLDSVKLLYEMKNIASPLSGNAKETIVERGEITLPKVEPGEKSYTSALKWRNADILELAAISGAGDTIDTWSFPMKYADEYFAKEKGVAAKRNKQPLSVEFDKATGMLHRVSVGGKEIPFNNGPLPVGMRMELKSITKRTEGQDTVYVMKYKGAVDSIVWRISGDGLLGMDALILNRKDGGGFEGQFFDKQITNLGFTFSYPESCVESMEWLGKGPYRVWRNRQEGMNIGLWQKAYNNTVTGESAGELVYPEFKGYHGNTYWATIKSEKTPFTVYSETDGVYLRMFSPDEPGKRRKGEDTMRKFPEGDISFLLEIPGMRSYKPIEQLGPEAQASHIRINKGDEGIRIKLWFDFRS